MAKVDVSEVKRKIIEILDKEGPSLPIPVAKKINMQPMFASAILSELLNEKRLKISSMKVGSSPLYYIPGQEEKLISFTENLGGVEKEAYLKLRDNKFLEDATQEPKIRVALRAIKDFATPIQLNGKLYWKYLTTSEEKIKKSLEDEGEVAIGERVVGQQIWEDIKKEKKKSEEKTPQKHKILDIFAKDTENLSREEKTKEKIESSEIVEEILKEETPKVMEVRINTESKKTKVKRITEKDLLLENAKKILREKNIEILQLISFDKKQLIAKARVMVDKTCILIFIDKKRPEEKDLVKAYKKSLEFNLPYYIITQSEPNKKLKEKSDIFRSLLGFDSFE